MPTTTPTADEVMGTFLGYGECTIGDMRKRLASYGALADERSSELAAATRGRSYSDDEWRDSQLVHAASWSSWSLVALLGWLAEKHPDVAKQAAYMVDDIGCNGGNDYCEDVAAVTTAKGGGEAA